ncbi:MAG: hypothetical protein ABSG28_07925 [Methanoregula sp.]|jgi:uncharacterized membrane protein|uniref:hypothetical protein n=1 Tax=Methanoregula sp. TaxID=2052170 RepID=UPI003C1B77F8
MERAAVMTVLRLACGALGWCVLLGLVLPLGAAYLLGLSPAPALALIASAFLIEYGAIPIGIGLSLPPQYVLPAAISIEAGIFLGIYGSLDTIGKVSGRVAGFLEKTKTIAGRSKMFDRYGMYGLFPCEILIGVYLCAPASRLFGWQRGRSFAITMAGYCVAAVVTTLATLGLIRYFFS